MLLSVTEAAKIAGCARSTIYDKINSGELSRSPGGKIDTAELQRVFGDLQTVSPRQPDIESDKTDTMASELLDMVQAKDSELSEVRTELDDTRRRLNEHREAARSLMSPEDVQARLDKAVKAEKAGQAEREKKWQKAIADRKQEIQQARAEADEIRQREKEHLDALKAERDRVEALESRGLIARLFNKKPEPAG